MISVKWALNTLQEVLNCDCTDVTLIQEGNKVVAYNLFNENIIFNSKDELMEYMGAKLRKGGNMKRVVKMNEAKEDKEHVELAEIPTDIPAQEEEVELEQEVEVTTDEAELAVRDLIRQEWAIVDMFKGSMVREGLSEEAVKILEEAVVDCYTRIGQFEQMLPDFEAIKLETEEEEQEPEEEQVDELSIDEVSEEEEDALKDKVKELKAEEEEEEQEEEE